MQNFVHVSLGPLFCCCMYVWKWLWFWMDDFVCCMDQWNSNEVKSDCFGLILLRFWSFSFVLLLYRPINFKQYTQTHTKNIYSWYRWCCHTINFLWFFSFCLAWKYHCNEFYFKYFTIFSKNIKNGCFP